jgi:hypothetical protein
VVLCLARVWLEVGAFGYDSGSIDGRKETAAHPCIVLPPEQSSQHRLTAIMLDAQWVYVGLIVHGLLCVPRHSSSASRRLQCSLPCARHL